MASFDDQCRLCLDNPGVIGIFETQDFHHDIFACTGVKMYPLDNLPQSICSACSEIVKNAAKLRQVAIKSNDTLMMFVKDVCDEESRDTLCISPMEQSLEMGHTSQSLLYVNETGENKQGHSLKKKIKIRTDLFETASSTSNNIIVVRSKKDYDREKLRIKENPDYQIEYICEICEKKSETWKKLYQHLRNHDKKFCCPIELCGKKFATKGDLEKHLRTHTGVKPYTCDICDKSFTQQGALKAHKENVHMCYTVP